MSAAVFHQSPPPSPRPGSFAVAELIVETDGRVSFASAAARSWLSLPGFASALSTQVAGLNSHEPVTVKVIELANATILRLDGDEGRMLYLVHLVPVSSWPPTSSLSPTQLRVAERAALGMTVEAVATELAIKAHTVRSHLKEAYRRLDVANRVELADALRRRSG